MSKTIELPYKAMYMFIDEGGNLDFSPTGSKYFTLTSVCKFRPFILAPQLDDLRFELLESGTELEYFHCSEDRQAVRDRVFSILTGSTGLCRVDSLIVEKAKTYPPHRAPEKFYPWMLGYLVKYALKRCWDDSITEVIVITDTLPIAQKREAVRKAVITTLKNELPPHHTFRVLHFQSRSCYGLQVADYYNWAVGRKWERGDTRSYDLIQHQLSSEFEIFKNGTTYYYEKAEELGKGEKK